MDNIEVSWSDAELPGFTVALGLGDGDRLVVPGVPQTLKAVGSWLVWITTQAVVFADPTAGRGRVIALADMDGDNPAVLTVAGGEALVTGDSGVTVVAPERGAFGFLGTDLIDDLDRVRVGGCLLVEAAEERACFTLRGVAVELPAPARSARIVVPLADRDGVAWADDEVLYRSEDGKAVEVGELPGPARYLAAGPGGVLLVSQTSGETWVVGRGRPVALAEDVLPETARFSPDGTRALVGLGSGCGLMDLTTGACLKRWRGCTPVGFMGDRCLLLDEARGVVVDGDGREVMGGFTAAGVCYDAPTLVGPGGAVWDLTSGEMSSPVGTLDGSITAIQTWKGEQVVSLSDRAGVVLDEDGDEVSRWRIPLFPDSRAEQTLSTIRTGGGSDLDDGDADEIVEAAWLGDQVLLLTADGDLGLVNPADGALVYREALGDYMETDGWSGLTPLPRGRVLVRIGDAARLLPGGETIAAPKREVDALVVFGDQVVRAWGGRVESAPLPGGGGAEWSVSLDARLLAVGRRLMAAEGDDLVVLETRTGYAVDRNIDALEGCNAMAALSDGNLWAWGGFEGEARVIRLDGRTGRTLSSWDVPADGVVTGGGAAWAWTDEGALLRLALEG